MSDDTRMMLLHHSTSDLIEELLMWKSLAAEHSDRIAEISQAVGLITTLKPTMVMDAEHPLEMAKEVAEYVTARITELEQDLSNKEIEYTDLWGDMLALQERIADLEAEIDIRKDQLREAKNILIDKNLQIDSLYEEGYKLQQRIADLEAEHVVWLNGAENIVKRLKGEIAELEAERNWIPVSERLPDTKIVYDKFDVIVELVDIVNGETIRRVELMSYDYRNKSWNDDCGEYGFQPVAGVTHWRERPTPPEVQE